MSEVGDHADDADDNDADDAEDIPNGTVGGSKAMMTRATRVGATGI